MAKDGIGQGVWGWKMVVRGVLIGLAAGILAGLIGCGDGKEPEWKQARIVAVNRPEGVALASLAKVILEDRFRLEVEIEYTDAASAYRAIAEGGRDFFLGSWQPVTDRNYLQRHGDEFDDLGINYAGARTGLVVPGYVTLDSVTQLVENRDRFQGRIIGVEAEAGIMGITDSVIRAYELDYTLVPSSSPALASVLRQAIVDSQWVVVTGWQPHWMVERWELKFLVDTLRLYGETENIHTVARKNARSEKAQFAEFFERFRLDSVQMHGLMGMIADPKAGGPEDEARAWAALHSGAVDVWVGEAKKEDAGAEGDTAEAAGDTAGRARDTT